MKIAARIISGIIFLALLALFTVRAGFVLMPPRTSMGSTWEMYGEEQKNSIDVLFFGSSVVYCDIIPAEIYRKSGLTSYVCAGPEQTLSLTYYAMAQAFETQSPAVACLEISAIQFRKYQNYTKVNIGYMPYFSRYRRGAIQSACEPEERWGLIFPLYSYHDRWTEVTPSALWEKREDEKSDIYAGYVPVTAANTQRDRFERKRELDDEIYSDNLHWLWRIISLCRRKNVELVLYVAPAYSVISDEWIERIHLPDGYSIINMNSYFDDFHFDYTRDFFDAMHCDICGALRVSDHFAELLSEKNIKKHEHSEQVWQERCDALAEICKKLNYEY